MLNNLGLVINMELCFLIQCRDNDEVINGFIDSISFVFGQLEFCFDIVRVVVVDLV